MFDAAILLAAGPGRRMQPVTQTPKPLLPLSGQPGSERFLDFHLTAVASAGVRAVAIVGSRAVTRAPLRSILTLGPGVEVRMVESTVDPATHGTAWSLGLALEEASDMLVGKRVLIINAGVVYHPSLLARLAAHDPGRSAVLVGASRSPGGTECWVHDDAPAWAGRLGRGLDGTPAVEGMVCAGGLLGVTSVTAGDVESLRRAVRWAVDHTSGRTRARYDEAIQMLVERGRVDAVAVNDSDRFLAVDTPDDYAHLITEHWPALQQAR